MSVYDRYQQQIQQKGQSKNKMDADKLIQKLGYFGNQQGQGVMQHIKQQEENKFEKSKVDTFALKDALNSEQNRITAAKEHFNSGTYTTNLQTQVQRYMNKTRPLIQTGKYINFAGRRIPGKIDIENFAGSFGYQALN